MFKASRSFDSIEGTFKDFTLVSSCYCLKVKKFLERAAKIVKRVDTGRISLLLDEESSSFLRNFAMRGCAEESM